MVFFRMAFGLIDKLIYLLVGTGLKFEIDNEVIRFQVHHIILAIIAAIQSLCFAVQGKADSFQQRRFAAANFAENAKYTRTN